MTRAADHADLIGDRTSTRSTLVALMAIIVATLCGLTFAGVAGAGEPDPPVLDDAQLFVEPATDLVDRQTVAVTGVDFDPHLAAFGAAQCDAALVAELAIDGCDISTAAVGSIDAEGGAELDLVVRRIITTPGGGEIDCAIEGACVIGAGTLDDTLTMVIEGTAAPISFDPAVPPTPPLTIDVAVDDVTADHAMGTVTCNREATFNLNAQLSQTKGPHTAQAFGSLFDNATCDVTPTDWAITLMPGARRFTGGPATATLDSFAFDGFESTFNTQMIDVQLTGGARDRTLPPNVQGEFTSIAIIGATDDGSVEVEVVCEIPFELGSVSVSVSQWAGLQRITGFGGAPLDGCDGTERVTVPVQSFDGVLVGGPAQVVASVFVQTFTPPDTFLFDSASTSGVIRRSGRTQPLLFTPVLNPDSRISIDAVTRTSVSGTIECEEPVQVFVDGFAVKSHGRTVDAASGFDMIVCDGTTPFVLDLAEFDNGLRGGGEVAVSVFASAFTPDGFGWSDNQQASAQLRGR